MNWLFLRVLLSWEHGSDRWFDIRCSNARRYLCRTQCESPAQPANEDPSSFEQITFIAIVGVIASLIALTALLYGKNLRDSLGLQKELDYLKQANSLQPQPNEKHEDAIATV